MRHSEPDPADEYFDVVDESGQLTGEVKRRADVHRDGDWHRAFHCWVAFLNEAGEPAILFQRRSLNKDTYPNHLDVAVGGHYRAGEGFDEVVREIDEELGFDPGQATLTPVGRRWAEGLTTEWLDREIEDVYIHHLNVPVTTLRPSFEEIIALDVIDLQAIEAVFNGGVERIPSIRYPVQPENTLAPAQSAEVTIDDFIPVDDDYWVAGSRAAAAVLQGANDVRLQLKR